MILIELQPIAPARQALRLQLIVDCARETDASIAHYRRLRPPHRRVDTGFILEKKSGAIVGSFITNYPDCARRTDTFSFSTIINIDKSKKRKKNLQLSRFMFIYWV